MKDINYSSWHSILYRSTYGVNENSLYKMPVDTCTYYKRLIIAIVFAIPALPGHLLNLIGKFTKDKNSNGPSIWFAFHVPFWYGMGYLMERDNGKNLHPDFSFWHDYCLFWLMILTLCVVGAIIFGVVYAVYTGLIKLIDKCVDIYWDIINNREEKMLKDNKEKKSYLIIDMYRSLKNKYCNKINWTNVRKQK